MDLLNITIKGVTSRKDDMLSLDDDDNGIARKLSVMQKYYGDENNDHFDLQLQILKECLSNYAEYEQQIFESAMQGVPVSEIAQQTAKTEEAVRATINLVRTRIKSQARKLYKTKSV